MATKKQQVLKKHNFLYFANYNTFLFNANYFLVVKIAVFWLSCKNDKHFSQIASQICYNRRFVSCIL